MQKNPASSKVQEAASECLSPLAEELISRKAAASLQRRLLHWYQSEDRELPWRSDWQKTKNPYPVWVSEIMLQQTQVKTVIPVYLRFMKSFPTVEALAQASEDQVRTACRGLGYYRRFRFMHQAAKQLCGKSLVWPESYEKWLELAGIGNYTAAAISSIAFSQPVVVVDGNVERVFSRLLDLRCEIGSQKLKKAFFDFGSKIISPSEPGDFNQALMQLGQTVCKKSKPECPRCPLSLHCEAFAQNTMHLSPKPKTAKSYQEVRGILVIAFRNSKVGLYKRPEKARFLSGHLGFFTLLEKDQNHYQIDGLDYDTRLAIKLRPLGQIKHTITKHRFQLRVAYSRESILEPHKLKWLELDQVEEALVSNMDRKAWKLFLASRSKD